MLTAVRLKSSGRFFTQGGGWTEEPSLARVWWTPDVDVPDRRSTTPEQMIAEAVLQTGEPAFRLETVPMMIGFVSAIGI